MIYLVSKKRELFEDTRYTIIEPLKAIEILYNTKKTNGVRILGADTETEGLDVFTKKLLTIQLGTPEFQVVWDCLSYDVRMLKDLLEDDNTLTIWWNYLFDGKFLLHHRILPKHVYDGFLAEKLLYNGYPAGTHSLSLKSAGYEYCGVELDKTVRGQIIKKGLTPDVIVYAAYDVKYEIPIYEAQLKELEKKGLLNAIKIENEFVKVLVYIEYCGVKLDIPRWKKKMAQDLANTVESLSALNQWVVDYYTEHNGSRRILKGKQQYTIELDYIIDKLEKGKRKSVSYTPPLDWEPIGPVVDVQTDTYTGHSQRLRIAYPFITQDFQGDLFGGWDTDPKCSIKWQSSKQTIPFFELLGFNLETFDKKTKAKKKSAEAKIIKPQKDISPVAGLYLKYKKAQKVVESFGQNFLDAVNPVTGRIHADFHQLGADTGRMSCGGGETGINLQQLPHDAETRACFIAEEGNKWISADYQSQESRLIASVANDPAMIDLFLHGCGDVHSLVAKMSYPSIIGDCPVEEIKDKFKEYRQDAKGIEFAVNPTLEYFSKIYGKSFGIYNKLKYIWNM